MSTKDDAKRRIQRLLWRRGIQVGAYRWTYPARRQRLWSPVTHVLDVGANSGQYGLEIRAHGYEGTIHSFEPLADPFLSLDAAAAADGRWNAYPYAIGDETGEVTMNVSEVSTFSSALPITDATIAGFAPATYVRQEVAPIRRLDDLVPDLVAGAPYAVKMDVQGFERQVIEGGERAMAGATAVEVELCPVELYEGEWMMLELMRAMDDRAFVPVLIDNAFPQPDGRSLAFNGLFMRAQ